MRWFCYAHPMKNIFLPIRRENIRDKTKNQKKILIIIIMHNTTHVQKERRTTLSCMLYICYINIFISYLVLYSGFFILRFPFKWYTSANTHIEHTIYKRERSFLSLLLLGEKSGIRKEKGNHKKKEKGKTFLLLFPFKIKIIKRMKEDEEHTTQQNK